MKKRDRLSRRQRLAVSLLGLGCAAALVLLLLLSSNSEPQVEYAAFSPPPFEESAFVGVPEPDGALGWSEFAVREGYVFHLCGVLRSAADGSLPVFFSSAADNRVWLRLRLHAADGAVIAQTGVIRPGETVEALLLSESAASGTVRFEIMGYEPETYYSAGTVWLETQLSVAPRQ